MFFVDLEKAFDHVLFGAFWVGAPNVWLDNPFTGCHFLLGTIQSLYKWKGSLVLIADIKLDLFPLHSGIRQGCFL